MGNIEYETKSYKQSDTQTPHSGKSRKSNPTDRETSLSSEAPKAQDVKTELASWNNTKVKLDIDRKIEDEIKLQFGLANGFKQMKSESFQSCSRSMSRSMKRRTMSTNYYSYLDEEITMDDRSELFQKFYSFDIDPIRRSYISRLYSKGLLNKKENTSNCIFIFDWDDMLIDPTDKQNERLFLMKNSDEKSNIGSNTSNILAYRKTKSFEIRSNKKSFSYTKKSNPILLDFKEEQLNKLNLLEFIILCILTHVVDNTSDVYILTKLNENDLLQKAELFYPTLRRLIAENSRIQIVSTSDIARDTLLNNRSFSSLKYCKFEEIVGKYDKSLLTNMIILTENVFNLEALNRISQRFDSCFVKSIRLIENPSIDELVKEAKLIRSQIEKIYSCAKNFNLKVKRSSL